MFKPILSLLVIVSSVGFSLFYVLPVYRQLGMKQADLTMLNDTIKQTDEVKDVIDQTKKSMDEVTAAEDARFKTFLPEQIDEIRFINNIVRAGAMRNIVIEGITIAKAKEGTGEMKTEGSSAFDGLKKVFSLTGQESGGVLTSDVRESHATIKANFSFIASYPATLLFLGDLEKSLNLININSLSFREYTDTSDKKGVKSSSIPLYQATIEIETYSLK